MGRVDYGGLGREGDYGGLGEGDHKGSPLPWTNWQETTGPRATTRVRPYHGRIGRKEIGVTITLG
jgi:hypothetical protein